VGLRAADHRLGRRHRHKDLPHAGLMLLVWAAGGLLVLAGALTFAELGVLYPRAGGIYQYLKEAYGPVWGFLYGWTAFLVIMSGGIAALGVAFGEYLGSFIPFFSTRHLLLAVPIGGYALTCSAGEVRDPGRNLPRGLMYSAGRCGGLEPAPRYSR
jgi:amino acid transporter